MTVQPLWWRVGMWLVVAVWAVAAVVVGRMVLANDDNGAAWVPQVEIGEPLVCGTFGCEPVNGGGR